MSTSPLTILVTGANGQVGRSLKKALDQKHFTCHFLSREAFDLSNANQMQGVLADIKPNIIVNAAAYTKVDDAETNQALTFTINSDACKILAKYTKRNDGLLVHFSSDYVYHNDENRPLKETDPCAPKSVYAQSKADGEKAITSHCDRYFIFRTSWVYDAFGQNFVRTMLALSSKYPQLTVVDDQIGSPTYAPDLADVVALLAKKYADGNLTESAYGTYNFSNEGVCSWYDFALAIFSLKGIDIPVKPVPSTAFPRPAARPHYSVMDKSKVRELLGDSYTIPHWRASLSECLSLLSEESE